MEGKRHALRVERDQASAAVDRAYDDLLHEINQRAAEIATLTAGLTTPRSTRIHRLAIEITNGTADHWTLTPAADHG